MHSANFPFIPFILMGVTALLVVVGLAVQANSNLRAGGGKSSGAKNSPGGTGSSSNNAGKEAIASENLQTALDQAAQAEQEVGNASSGDRNSRLGAAERARYNAGAARAAADRATSAGANAGGTAADLAGQARAAAERAKAAADRATYNANT